MRLVLKMLLFRVLNYLAALMLTAMLLAGVTVIAAWTYLESDLPETDVLRDIRLQVPLRVYSSAGDLIAEYGTKRREPVGYDEVPKPIEQAVLAAEDANFFKHPGVDYRALVRAAVSLVKTGQRKQGGSTITMQLARNFFLSPEKTYIRKVREIMLAMRMEEQFSKKEILTLYLNQIYLGNRAYGIRAAAHTYYNKELDELTLAETAMIAGLPKAPSAYNPLVNPQRAVERRNYVLDRMAINGFISEQEKLAAQSQPVTARYVQPEIGLEAAYVGEMVRAEMVSRYGEEAYTGGYHVTTTIIPRLQRAANTALREVLDAYDKRHGYRGPEQQLEVSIWQDAQRRSALLQKLGNIGELRPAVVTGFPDEKSVEITLADNSRAIIGWEGLSWAGRYRSANWMGQRPRKASDVLNHGDLIRVLTETSENGDYLRLAQVPKAQGALVSVKPGTGEVVALTGGYDYYHSKFNRATQAYRQPGSGFKPFIYSAALAAGYQPSDVINDAPVVIKDDTLPGGYWRPANYNHKFSGPTPLRRGMALSKNLVSIRLLRSIGVDFALQHLGGFGFDMSRFPRGLAFALGTVEVTPLQMAGAYTAFANNGRRVRPYFIDRIEQEGVGLIYTATPDVTVAITPENRFLMYSMMKDVINYGTGRRARSLERSDLAGKTGTTDDYKDAWFNGFNESVVAIVYVGMDDSTTLGKREEGSRAALPAWISYMEEAMKGLPETEPYMPSGIESTEVFAGGSSYVEYMDTTTEPNYVPEVSSAISSIDESPSAEDDLF
jgi:penicillin-binding protein 1A